MLRVLVTDTFVEYFNKLESNTKQYSCIKKNLIKQYLNCKSFDEIFNFGRKLGGTEVVKRTKDRLKSCTNRGSSYGFRVYTLKSKGNSTAYLIIVYPKYGKDAIDSLNDEFVSGLYSELEKQINNNSLRLMRIATKGKNKIEFIDPKEADKDKVDTSKLEEAQCEEE